MNQTFNDATLSEKGLSVLRNFVLQIPQRANYFNYSNYTSKISYACVYLNIRCNINILLFQIRNPTFVFISLAGCSESLIIFGVSAFSFKYLAEMYSMGFDTAGILLGNVVLYFLFNSQNTVQHELMVTIVNNDYF